MFSIVLCPDCGHPAVVTDRPVLESTSGPVEHVRTLCPEGHHLFMPTAGLEQFAPSWTALAS